MERNLTKCVHVEFYGLPGSGKSTISHMLAEELRAKGFDVYEPSYNSDHMLHPIVRKIFKLYKTTLFSLRYPRLVKEIYELLFQGKRIELLCFLKHFLNIAPKIICYLNSQSKIYIWDEGLVQSSIAATLDNPTNTDIIANKLISISGDREIIKVYVKTKVETAFKRLACRETQDSRIEKEQDIKKRRYIMNQFKKCCDKIKVGNNLSKDNKINVIHEIIKTLVSNNKR